MLFKIISRHTGRDSVGEEKSTTGLRSKKYIEVTTEESSGRRISDLKVTFQPPMLNCYAVAAGHWLGVCGALTAGCYTKLQ